MLQGLLCPCRHWSGAGIRLLISWHGLSDLLSKIPAVYSSKSLITTRLPWKRLNCKCFSFNSQEPARWGWVSGCPVISIFEWTGLGCLMPDCYWAQRYPGCTGAFVCCLSSKKTWIGIRTSRRWGPGWSQVRSGLGWICLGYERLHRSPHNPKQPLLLLQGAEKTLGMFSYQHWAGFRKICRVFLAGVSRGSCVCVLELQRRESAVVVVPLELQSVDIFRLSELHLGSVGVA